MSWRLVAIVWGIALAVFLALALLVGCSGPRGAAPSATTVVEPATARSGPAPTAEEEVVAAREAAFRALLAEAAEQGCRAVSIWESIVRRTRIVEYDCAGLSIAQVFAWDGVLTWRLSELFAPVYKQGPPLLRNGFEPPAIEGQRAELRQIMAGEEEE